MAGLRDEIAEREYQRWNDQSVGSRQTEIDPDGDRDFLTELVEWAAKQADATEKLGKTDRACLSPRTAALRFLPSLVNDFLEEAGGGVLEERIEAELDEYSRGAW